MSGYMQAKKHEGDEVEEGGPEHGILRPQHAGRDDRGYGVGGVMQAIEEVKGQGNQNKADKREGNVMHRCFPA